MNFEDYFEFLIKNHEKERPSGSTAMKGNPYDIGIWG